MGRLVEKTRAFIESRHVLWGVFLASLAETTVVPIPIEVVLIPVMLANHTRTWRIALFTLLGCLTGASLGYLVGYGAYEAVGEPFMSAVGADDEFARYTEKLEGDGFWYVLMIALTPIPFQIAYVGAGVVKMPFLVFLAAAIVGRGIRYFGLALLVRILGATAGPWLERNQYRIAMWATGIFIGGFTLYQVVS